MIQQDDFQVEPIRGLPEALPRGEEILWQGGPSFWALAREAYGVLWIAAGFAALALWRVIAAFAGAPWEANIALAIAIVLVGGVVLFVVLIMAWLQAREAVYTLTTSRVVLRFGVFQTRSIQIPYSHIRSADLALRRDGTGSIVLDTMKAGHLSYILTWPHVRPWKSSPIQPAMRCVKDATAVAKILAEAAETSVQVPAIELSAAPIAAPAE